MLGIEEKILLQFFQLHQNGLTLIFTLTCAKLRLVSALAPLSAADCSPLLELPFAVCPQRAAANIAAVMDMGSEASCCCEVKLINFSELIEAI